MTGFEIKIFISVHVTDSVDNNKVQQLGLYVWKKKDCFRVSIFAKIKAWMPMCVKIVLFLEVILQQLIKCVFYGFVDSMLASWLPYYLSTTLQ